MGWGSGRRQQANARDLPRYRGDLWVDSASLLTSRSVSWYGGVKGIVTDYHILDPHNDTASDPVDVSVIVCTDPEAVRDVLIPGYRLTIPLARLDGRSVYP